MLDTLKHILIKKMFQMLYFVKLVVLFSHGFRKRAQSVERPSSGSAGSTKKQSLGPREAIGALFSGNLNSDKFVDYIFL